MKATIHIPTQPRPGRATASIYCYPYNPATGKTMTRYVGSFRVDLNPDAVPRGVDLQPGTRRDGISISPQAPFTLKLEHLEGIRAWLEAHGTYRRTVAEQIARTEQERAALKSALREEVRRELEQEQLAARQAQWSQTVGSALMEAETAVLRACDELLTEAKAATARGSQLTHRRSLNTTLRPDMSDLDILQARANRVRVDAIARLEQVCQAAGLMVRPERKRGKASALDSSPPSGTPQTEKFGSY